MKSKNKTGIFGFTSESGKNLAMQKEFPAKMSFDDIETQLEDVVKTHLFIGYYKVDNPIFMRGLSREKINGIMQRKYIELKTGKEFTIAIH